ncbi:MAG: RNA polymerase factor sigma-54 [Bacteroides sp.]|nr:RNA polymerase factor sigma-54 [Bacteroides sp.]MBD5371085.1 RNA polymerase factor sigma-54 [Bacteroides sp.]
MAQELSINQRLGQYLTQQQLRFVKMLELNAPELDEAVSSELEANPALDVADPEAERERRDREEVPREARYAAARRSADTADLPVFTPRDDTESLYDLLYAQIAERSVAPRVAEMARYIVGNLDSNGYLRRSLPQMVDDFVIGGEGEIGMDDAREAFDLVRGLDPAGVGAEGLRDCLLLQLRRLPGSQERDDAIAILEEQFEAYTMRHSHRIISALHLTQERVDAANALILTLNPKPGAPYGGAQSTAMGVISPDVVVSREGNEFYVSLPNRIPELRIEEGFAEAMRGMERRRGRPRKGTEFVASRYNDARDFIQVLRQRQQTMTDVMTAILSLQKPYFETGDIYALRPMILKDITRLTGLDASTVSRATANKYVETPWGNVVPLKSFFSDTVNASVRTQEAKASDSPEASGSDHLTNRQIEAILRRLVDGEDKRHPLSDERLRQELLDLGYDVSRRTVAKYRDRAGILVARLRRRL